MKPVLSALLVACVGCSFAGRASAQETDAAASPTPRNSPAAGPTTPGASAPERAVDEAAILEPSQGRPVILRAGEQFRFLMRLGTGIEGNVMIRLRHARVPSLEINLKSEGEMAIFQQRYASLVLGLPDQLPLGMYDLVLKSKGLSLTARHSIKVVDAFKSRFRFVHLSDMNIGDPSAPMFDDRLVDEVNLLSPEFIVATGDFTAWGRALNDSNSWQQTLDFFARFHAPVFMVCGDQDHQPSFVRYVAQSPVGTFDYGRYHALLLLDHALQPLDRHQIDFIRRDLDVHTDSIFNFIVTHDDALHVLDDLTARDGLADYLKTRKVKMIITGGSDDWDRKENATKLQGLDLAYVRTHQSSTCLRGRATGISHYRVIEVDGENISYTYPAEDAAVDTDHSIAVGRLRVFTEEESSGRTTVSVQNALNQPFAGARVWAKVAKLGEKQPQVAGGTLVQVLDGGDHWECEIAVDLPDKGGIKVLASTEESLPPPIGLTATFDGEAQLKFKREQTESGLAYFTSGQELHVTLANAGDQPVKTYPVLRLNGKVLSITVDGAEQWPVEVPAGGRITLAPKLMLARVSPGEHALQLLYLDDPIRRVTTFPMKLVAE